MLIEKTPEPFYCLRCGFLSYLVGGRCAGCGAEINLPERGGEEGRTLRTRRARERMRTYHSSPED